MVLAIDYNTKNASVMGINKYGELGIGNKSMKKIFTKVDELNGKEIEEVGIGKLKSFVVAIG